MAAHVCEPVGDFLCPEDRPSPIFSTFAAVINFISGVWAFIVAVSGDCESTPRTWLLLGCVNCFGNFVFAFYIYHRFAAKVRGDGETPGLAPGDAACKLFMYDWGCCSYMVFLVWQLVWFFLAISVGSDYSGDRCGDQLHTAAILLALYAAIGVGLMILSLFTECCRTPQWQGHHQQRRSQPVGVVSSVATAAGRTTNGVVRSLFGPSTRQQQQPHPSSPPPAPAPQTPSYYGGNQAPAGQLYATAPPPQNPNYQA